MIWSLWVIGIGNNLVLIFNLLCRKSLWSTINTFMLVLLFLNLICLVVQVIITFEEKKYVGLREDDDALFQALNMWYNDDHRSVVCSIQYLSFFIYGSFSLYLLLGVIFIRSIMVKHASFIRQDESVLDVNQARLRVIGVLIAICVSAMWLAITFGIIFLPRSPFDYVLVKSCRGIDTTYPKEEMQKIVSRWLTRLFFLSINLLGIFSCQVSYTEGCRKKADSFEILNIIFWALKPQKKEGGLSK